MIPKLKYKDKLVLEILFAAVIGTNKARRQQQQQHSLLYLLCTGTIKASKNTLITIIRKGRTGYMLR